jgi:thioredoxin reductase (NADPH)
VLLVEALAVGGQILASQKIENYPALPEADGYTFAEHLQSQVTALGVQIEYGTATAVRKQADGFAVELGSKTVLAISVILATGLKHRKLGVAGEEALIGRGVSFCATCDGMFFRGREVAVVGGGNTAVQDALVLSDFCSCVYLIHRRRELRAERGLVERMLARENIEFLTDTVISEIRGEGRVSSLLLSNVATGDVRELNVAGLFEAIGQIPQNEAFRDLTELDADGYFIVDEDMKTSADGIFAAGDACRKTVRQLTTAVADGTVAALSAAAYIDAFKERGEHL